MIRRGFLVAMLALSAMAFAGDVVCPIDDMGMYFTGQTKTVDGRMLYQYRCPRGHTAWVVQ